MSELVVGEAENGEVVPGLYYHPEGGQKGGREGGYSVGMRQEEGWVRRGW